MRDKILEKVKEIININNAKLTRITRNKLKNTIIRNILQKIKIFTMNGHNS
jgi:hypothetical protein